MEYPSIRTKFLVSVKFAPTPSKTLEESLKALCLQEIPIMNKKRRSLNKKDAKFLLIFTPSRERATGRGRGLPNSTTSPNS